MRSCNWISYVFYKSLTESVTFYMQCTSSLFFIDNEFLFMRIMTFTLKLWFRMYNNDDLWFKVFNGISKSITIMCLYSSLFTDVNYWEEKSFAAIVEKIENNYTKNYYILLFYRCKLLFLFLILRLREKAIILIKIKNRMDI